MHCSFRDGLSWRRNPPALRALRQGFLRLRAATLRTGFPFIGIRGAFEHTVGIRRAGTIVAINKNHKAPMFQNADIGIVGDYAEVVPLLTAALKQARPKT